MVLVRPRDLIARCLFKCQYFFKSEISYFVFGLIIYDVPSINTKSFITAENDECLKKETIYQTLLL